MLRSVIRYDDQPRCTCKFWFFSLFHLNLTDIEIIKYLQKTMRIKNDYAEAEILSEIYKITIL